MREPLGFVRIASRRDPVTLTKLIAVYVMKAAVPSHQNIISDLVSIIQCRGPRIFIYNIEHYAMIIGQAKMIQLQLIYH